MYLKEKSANHSEKKSGIHKQNSPSIGSEIAIEKLRSQIGDTVLSELLGLATGAIEIELDKLGEAIQKRDSELILLISHTIKGTAASMFALRLSEQGKIMEGLSKNFNDADDYFPRLRHTALKTYVWWRSKAN